MPAVVPKDEAQIESTSLKRSTYRSRSDAQHAVLASLIIVILLSLSLILENGRLLPPRFTDGSISTQTCTKPAIRREWRNLSAAEQERYIDAVRCLIEAPTTAGVSGNAHDAFSFVHSRFGNDCTFTVELSFFKGQPKR